VALILRDSSTSASTDYDRLRSVRNAYLAGLSPHTRRAYEGDLRDLARFCGVRDPLGAMRWILEAGQGEANARTLEYKAHLHARGLASATINRRLAAIRSTVKMARMAGIISWALDVPGEKAQPYRDTRGPGRAGFRAMLANAGGARPRDIRDRAIIRLLYDLALRRGEVAALDLGDVDLDAGKIMIRGKGRREKEDRTLPPETATALREWLEIRSDQGEPLFCNFDRAGQRTADGRLSVNGLYQMILQRAGRAGIRARPHGLRHAAITEALELTRGNVAAVQAFSRHKDPRTVMVYDDRRRDQAGEVAQLVAKAAAL